MYICIFEKRAISRRRMRATTRRSRVRCLNRATKELAARQDFVYALLHNFCTHTSTYLYIYNHIFIYVYLYRPSCDTPSCLLSLSPFLRLSHVRSRFFFFVRRKITGMYIIYIYMYKYNERGVQTRRAFWPFYPYYLALGRTFCVRRAH